MLLRDGAFAAAAQAETSFSQPPSILSTKKSVLTAFPVHQVPFTVQYPILVFLQRILEIICFDYSSIAMAEVLKIMGWECAEAVELNRWKDEFLKKWEVFPIVENNKQPIGRLLKSIGYLRHAAVHRVQVNLEDLDQFFQDAKALALQLGDEGKMEKLSQLSQALQAIITELQSQRNSLKLTTEETLWALAVQRECLDGLEAATITDMNMKDRVYRYAAWRNVEKAIASCGVSFPAILNIAAESKALTSGPDKASANGSDFDDIYDVSDREDSFPKRHMLD
ncbi:hypothetical protein QQS21_002303 [Conoideocrella luteorostrata]|uniref:Uncharacterized protein n=1 Tax=Conoideocrella luteorostrata TaxID=1105319 RepID=A0AAJ0CVI2_9HYPO|nr:hypothetical protein QQS21_002303 [Conoideocrella luteorostrata]